MAPASSVVALLAVAAIAVLAAIGTNVNRNENDNDLHGDSEEEFVNNKITNYNTKL